MVIRTGRGRKIPITSIGIPRNNRWKKKSSIARKIRRNAEKKTRKTKVRRRRKNGRTQKVRGRKTKNRIRRRTKT